MAARASAARVLAGSVPHDRDHLDRGQRLERPVEHLLDRLRRRAARQPEVGQRRLVDLDRVVARDRERASLGGQLVARRGVAALVRRPAELVLERAGRREWASARPRCRRAARPPPRACATSARARPGPGRRRSAAPASSAGSSSSPPSIARTRRRRSSGASAPGALSRAATTARHAGSDENVRGYGFGSIGIPYLRCRPGAPSASLASSPGSSVSTIMFSRQRSWSP